MNEGIGGSTVLAIIVFALAFILSYLAYNVNYTKAFRMKNKVIETYEKYNGSCESACLNEIKAYASEIGYSSAALANCKSLPYKPKNSKVIDDTTSYGFCVYRLEEEKLTPKKDKNAKYQSSPRYYYRVITRINIEIPIVQNIFDLGALYVTGDTKMFPVD